MICIAMYAPVDSIRMPFCYVIPLNAQRVLPLASIFLHSVQLASQPRLLSTMDPYTTPLRARPGGRKRNLGLSAKEYTKV
jgi:hypothetical protein